MTPPPCSICPWRPSTTVVTSPLRFLPLTAAALPTAVNLTWTEDPADVVAHRIRRGSQTVAVVPARTTTYLDQQLTPRFNGLVLGDVDRRRRQRIARPRWCRHRCRSPQEARSLGSTPSATSGAARRPRSSFPRSRRTTPACSSPSAISAMQDRAPNRPGAAYVRSRIPTMPIALVPGNHEDDNGGDGRIENFAACMGTRPPITGTYPRRYTIPLGNLARIIVISPAIPVNGVLEQFRPGSPERAWLVAEIAKARTRGPLGDHRRAQAVRVGLARSRAKSRPALQEVFSTADLVLFGHDHVYQRMHQVGTGAGCPVARVVPVTPQCIRDDGFDGQYVAGRGAGRRHRRCRGAVDQPPWLRRARTGRSWRRRAARTPWSPTDGFLTVTATSNSLHARFPQRSRPVRRRVHHLEALSRSAPVTWAVRPLSHGPFGLRGLSHVAHHRPVGLANRGPRRHTGLVCARWGRRGRSAGRSLSPRRAMLRGAGKDTTASEDPRSGHDVNVRRTMKSLRRPSVTRATAMLAVGAVLASLYVLVESHPGDGGGAPPVATVPAPRRRGSRVGRSRTPCPERADGLYWIKTPVMPTAQQVYCDQTTDGGGWLLIGRGREGWTFGDGGQGSTAADITRDPRTAPRHSPRATYSAGHDRPDARRGRPVLPGRWSARPPRDQHRWYGRSEEVRWVVPTMNAFSWDFGQGYALGEGTSANGLELGTFRTTVGQPLHQRLAYLDLQ